MPEYKVKIIGVSPVLHGRKDPRGDPPRGGEEREQHYDSAWEYTHYANQDSQLGQPSHVLKAVITAGLRAIARPGDKVAGKAKTEQMARACLRVEPVLALFGIEVPEEPEILGQAEAFALIPDEGLKAFVLKRLTSRGVEVSNLGISGWALEFEIVDSSDGFFSPEWLERGLTHAGQFLGMGTWRPEFGRFTVVSFEEVQA